MRAVAVFMVAILSLVLILSRFVPTSSDVPFNGPQIAFWLALLALSWWPAFERIWQSITALLALTMALGALSVLAPALAAQLGHNMLAVAVLPSVIQQKFHFVMQVMVLMVSLATLRLPWRPAIALYGCVLAGAIAVFALYFPIPLPVLDARFSLLPLVTATSALMLTSFVGEGLARRAFWANHQLEIERNDERRAHEQAESNLKVLGLLSVQKIVEAHGGEVYIEGFADGMPASGPFATAHGDYPAMLHGEFRTAFVATCPLAARE